MKIKQLLFQALNIKNVTACLFAMTLIWITLIAYYNIYLNPHSYCFGDWLINYADGGFKRRGLSGSLFFMLQDISGIKLQFFVLLTTVFSYALCFKFLFRILKNKSIDLFYFTLLLSPVTLLFYFNDTEAIGRKEIIFLAIFAAFVYYLFENKLSKKIEWLFLGLIVVATLVHEIIIFYMPYFFLALYIHEKKIELRRYTLFLGASLIPFLLISAFGKSINEGNTIAMLYQRGVVFNFYGIFMWPEKKEAILLVIEYIKEYFFNYSLYAVSILIAFIHFSGHVFITKKNLLKPFIFSFLILFAANIPLFVFALDWGRWIHIHFMLFLVLFAAKLPDITESAFVPVSLSKFKSSLKHLIIIAFSFMWAMPIWQKGFEFRFSELPFKSLPALLSTRNAPLIPDESIFIQQSQIMYYQEKYDKAIESCNMAISINPISDTAYFNLCASHIMREEFDEALAACNYALNINPFFESARHNRDWILQQKNAGYPLHSAAHYINLSLDYYNMGMYQESIEACKNALYIKADSDTAYYNMCCAYIQLEQWDNAIDACNTALRINPEHQAAKINRDWALSQKTGYN